MRIACYRSLCTGLLATVLLGCLASTSQAFWFDALWDHCGHGCKKNSQWPSPYVCPDRVYAHAPFNAMIGNGWRRQNLLGSHHFNEDSTQLTQAGELKVRWILTQAPPAYRRVFVERSTTDNVTQQRLATVQGFTARVATNGAVPQVTETHIVSEGRPAATVDFVNSQFRDNMRTPMLPVSTGQSSTQ